MECAIQTLAKVFLKSSKGKEDLGGKDFQRLVESQLSNILTDTDSKKAVAEMRVGLDANQDGKVGFEEYLKLVGYLATSLSEQRAVNREPPSQTAVANPELECTQVSEKEEVKPEAKAEDKAEQKEEDKAEDKAAEVTQPETAREEKPAPAPAVPTLTPAAPAEAAAEVVAAAEEVKKEVKEEVKEEANVEEAEKVENVKENLTPAKEEDEEKKTEEATS